MQFTMAHNNINVYDLEKSVAFYQKALGFTVASQKEGPNGAFKLAFMQDGQSNHRLELTWLADRKEPYDLGDNEIHLCVVTDDYDAAHALHRDMGCICYENEGMGLYFIEDPDGYWTEVVPKR